MAYDGAESTWKLINYGKFISQSRPDIIATISRLERIKIKEK